MIPESGLRVIVPPRWRAATVCAGLQALSPRVAWSDGSQAETVNRWKDTPVTPRDKIRRADNLVSSYPSSELGECFRKSRVVSESGSSVRTRRQSRRSSRICRPRNCWRKILRRHAAIRIEQSWQASLSTQFESNAFHSSALKAQERSAISTLRAEV